MSLKGRFVSFPFLFPAFWNVDLLAKARRAAIWDWEVSAPLKEKKE